MLKKVCTDFKPEYPSKKLMNHPHLSLSVLNASASAAAAIPANAQANATTHSTTPQPPLVEQYSTIRNFSEWLCQPLQIEDYGIQSMPDVSPPKWHLAHITWFFETFLLVPFSPGYTCFHPQFGYLFNSYYEAVGQRHPRPQRGLLSRPTVEEVYRYRAFVDEAMRSLLTSPLTPEIESLVVLGLHHEQQHQELLLMDIKHGFSINPLRPAYRSDLPEVEGAIAPQEHWLDYPGGLFEIGEAHRQQITNFSQFSFDNEQPQHRVYVEDYGLAARLVTNAEYLEFIEAGGYQKAEHWLSEGWATVQREEWRSPLYWEQIEGQWWNMTLGGMRPVRPDEPVCHVSYYEAEAFAHWAGKRLPTEAEWEIAAAQVPIQGNFVEQGYLHPTPARAVTRPDQIFGDVWEWTQSAYLPYPGFRTAPGAVGEYNGKFMSNQMVLRGGACVTAQNHMRASYRNFFPPSARWQFSGIRLATAL